MSCRSEIVFMVEGYEEERTPVRIYSRYNGDPEFVITNLKHFIEWNKKLDELYPGAIAANFVYYIKTQLFNHWEKECKPEELEGVLNYYMPGNYVFTNWEEEINSIVEYFYLVKWHIHKGAKSDFYVTDKVVIQTGRGLPNSFKSGEFKAIDTIEIKRGKESGEKSNTRTK